MFRVDTTYYCEKCKKVKVKNWQFSYEEGGEALLKFYNVMFKSYGNKTVLTAFTSISWIWDDAEQRCPQIEPMIYCHKTIDTQVFGKDSVIYDDTEVNHIYSEMQNMYQVMQKEVA